MTMTSVVELKALVHSCSKQWTYVVNTVTGENGPLLYSKKLFSHMEFYYLITNSVCVSVKTPQRKKKKKKTSST